MAQRVSAPAPRTWPSNRSRRYPTGVELLDDGYEYPCITAGADTGDHCDDEYGYGYDLDWPQTDERPYEDDTYIYPEYLDEIEQGPGHERPTVLDLLEATLSRIERLPARWMTTYAPEVIRVGLGLIFVWFGGLKLWPGLSPADGLVRATIDELFGLVGLGVRSALGVYLLGVFELSIGVGLLVDFHRRALIWLLIAHMGATALPLALLPGLIWSTFPHALTLEGQYIVKNLVLVGAAMAIGGAAAANSSAVARS